jgi:hypothetical protein
VEAIRNVLKNEVTKPEDKKEGYENNVWIQVADS